MVLFIVESVYKSLEVFLDVLFIVESVYKSLEVFLDGAIYRGKCLQVFRSVSGWCYLSWKVFTSL